MERPSRKEMRDVIASLGGEDEVAARLGVSAKAVLAAYDARAFPARWCYPLRTLATRAGAPSPGDSLFNWRELVEPGE